MISNKLVPANFGKNCPWKDKLCDECKYLICCYIKEWELRCARCKNQACPSYPRIKQFPICIYKYDLDRFTDMAKRDGLSSPEEFNKLLNEYFRLKSGWLD